MKEGKQKGARKARMSGVQKALIGGSLFALAGVAAASGSSVDTTAATEAFTGVETAVNSIGPVMLGAVAAGIIYKWVSAFLI